MDYVPTKELKSPVQHLGKRVRLNCGEELNTDAIRILISCESLN